MLAALRRLQEEDPTIDLHRDAQTGEQIVAGLSQVHVEVIVDRLRDRFGVEVSLQPPRVPYARRSASPRPPTDGTRSSPAGADSSATARSRSSRCSKREQLRVHRPDQGRLIPGSFIPAVEKGVREAMEGGVLAGYPVQGVRVRLIDGQHHSVDSSEIAFKLAGIHAMRARSSSPTRCCSSRSCS